MSDLSSIEDIRQSISLFLAPGAILEVRAPNSWSDGVLSGYFSDPEKLEHAILAVNGKAPGIYATINHVDPQVLARSVNRIIKASVTTKDTEITRRVWLLLD